MKKFIVVAALLLFPLFASAQGETLLTPDGTLYTIEEQSPAATGTSDSEATVQLLLTTRNGGNITRQIVPATLEPGVNSSAAMAYDAESGMLYIFWLRHTAMLESEMLFTSFDKDGNWAPATAFGQPFDYRENLRVAVTRKVVGAHDKFEPGITVHATWWETDTHTGKESAQYAILALEPGKVEVTFLNLGDYLTAGDKVELEKDELSILRQPVLFTSAKQESVLVTFGDLATNRLHRVRVYPVRPPANNGRIRIPVGRSEGGFNAPRFRNASNSTVNAVSGENDNLAFYVKDAAKLHYVLLRDGAWTDARAIALDEQITAPAAIDAIRRLVNEH